MNSVFITSPLTSLGCSLDIIPSSGQSLRTPNIIVSFNRRDDECRNRAGSNAVAGGVSARGLCFIVNFLSDDISLDKKARRDGRARGPLGGAAPASAAAWLAQVSSQSQAYQASGSRRGATRMG